MDMPIFSILYQKQKHVISVILYQGISKVCYVERILQCEQYYSFILASTVYGTASSTLVTMVGFDKYWK